MASDVGTYWPLFDLRITTPRIEMRIPTDDDLGEIIELARLGIHDDSYMPFDVPWTQFPSPAFEHNMVQFQWGTRANWKPTQWQAMCAVSVDGVIVGSQSFSAEDFANQRMISSGSWLGREYQGQGIGTEMRTAMLAFAFDHLGAQWAESSAYEGNVASDALSRKLGYKENGIRFQPREDGVSTAQKFLLSVDDWHKTPGAALDVKVTGFDRCRTMFGLD